MKKILTIVLIVVVAASIFYFTRTSDDQVNLLPNNTEERKSTAETDPAVSHAVRDLNPENPDSMEGTPKKDDVESFVSDEEILTNDPLFKNPPIERLFQVVSAGDLVQQLSDLDSPYPLDNGRAEILDNNGNVVARGYKSSQEEEELGFNDANRYRKEDIPLNELQTLSAKGDFAASVALARVSYQSQNWDKGDEYILLAARDQGKPAPFTIAGNIYNTYRGDASARVLAAAWYIAAFSSGDYTVAGRLRLSLGSLPAELQDEAIVNAIEFLSN